MREFDPASIQHCIGPMRAGDAVERVLPRTLFAAARDEISRWDGYAETPLIALPTLAQSIGIDALWYKDEGPRFGLGSFKALGGAYAALRLLTRTLSSDNEGDLLDEIRDGKRTTDCGRLTLVSATDGNHGRSLAWGCRRFGARCRIYIHAEVSDGRADAMRELGAEVIRIDGDYDQSVAVARDEAAANGWYVVSDTAWPGYTQVPTEVMAGYGIMPIEAADQLAEPPTHALVQGGVGGMAAAVASALVQRWGDAAPRIIVVEPDRAACLLASAKAGRSTTVSVAEETIMAGLSCGEPSPLAWEVLAETADDFLAIPDSMVAPAMRLLARPQGDDPRIQAGESAVAGLAALIAARRDPELSGKLQLDATSRALVFGSEGVTDPEIYATIMADETTP